MTLTVAMQPEWQMRAACRGPQSAVFYPPVHTEKRSDKRLRETRAKEICGMCAVITQCRAHALEVGEKHGIWGGLNELERRNMLRGIDGSLP